MHVFLFSALYYSYLECWCTFSQFKQLIGSTISFLLWKWTTVASTNRNLTFQLTHIVWRPLISKINTYTFLPIEIHLVVFGYCAHLMKVIDCVFTCRQIHITYTLYIIWIVCNPCQHSHTSSRYIFPVKPQDSAHFNHKWRKKSSRGHAFACFVAIYSRFHMKNNLRK